MRQQGRRTTVVLAGLLLSAGCASVDEQKKAYADLQPAIDLVQFFNGSIKAWGIVQDRSGELVQRFEVDIQGSHQGDTLTLDETFRYGVGEGPARRVWELTEGPDNIWVGTAGDILGNAQGEEIGNAFYWSYQMDLPVGDSSYKVTFDDWMWAFDDNTLMNRSYITKFGITFAEVTIFMQKQ